MDNNDKTWMYRRLENGALTNEYRVGVEVFVTFALSHPECLLNGKLRCPCNKNKCQNKCYLDEHTVKVHLCQYGFVSNYDNWYFHGEQYVRPFYPNVNMDVPTSSYRAPKVDYVRQKNYGKLSSDKVNSMFKHVVGGPKNGRMYGCGSMAKTFYPHDMAPRPRGGGSRSLKDSSHTREDFEAQNRVIEYLRVDLQASHRKNDMLEKKNDMLESRMSYLEDHVRLLVAGLPQGTLVQPQAQSSGRVLYGRGASSKGHSICGSSRPDPYTASSSRGDRFSAAASYHHTSSQVHRYSQQCVGPSQKFGIHDGANRDDDDADDDGAYDNDETRAP